jgi:regulatory protein YycH of two-component signal transduction system YycFG
MKYENIKSIILTILVLLSIVLTWNLWTYQPNYDKLEKSKTLAEVTVSEKQEVQTIIRPDQVLFHLKNGHFGTNNMDELDKVIKEMSKWTFTDVKSFSEKDGNIKELTHGTGNTEIIYPGDIPIELYRNVLKFQDKKLPSFSFNRIVINVENPEKEYGNVYFVSSDFAQVYNSHISVADLTNFNRLMYKSADQFPKYFAFEASDKRTIFLPENETKMTAYKYLPATLNSNDFKKALFSDPSFVQKSLLPQGNVEEYTNDISKMTANYDTNMLTYVNPTTITNFAEPSYDLVKRSIDFVNEHGGWSNSYRFVSKNDYSHSVTFRLYSGEGYPVFNEFGTSEINEVWGSDDIRQYKHPIIALDLPLTTEMQKVDRPSGHDILKFLKSKKDFNPALLEQMTLGYKMKPDSDEQRVILLEPAWFYRYDKKWVSVTMEDLGGLNHGLE